MLLFAKRASKCGQSHFKVNLREELAGAELLLVSAASFLGDKGENITEQ